MIPYERLAEQIFNSNNLGNNMSDKNGAKGGITLEKIEDAIKTLKKHGSMVIFPFSNFSMSLQDVLEKAKAGVRVTQETVTKVAVKAKGKLNDLSKPTTVSKTKNGARKTVKSTVKKGSQIKKSATKRASAGKTSKKRRVA